MIDARTCRIYFLASTALVCLPLLSGDTTAFAQSPTSRNALTSKKLEELSNSNTEILNKLNSLSIPNGSSDVLQNITELTRISGDIKISVDKLGSQIIVVEVLGTLSILLSIGLLALRFLERQPQRRPTDARRDQLFAQLSETTENLSHQATQIDACTTQLQALSDTLQEASNQLRNQSKARTAPEPASRLLSESPRPSTSATTIDPGPVVDAVTRASQDAVRATLNEISVKIAPLLDELRQLKPAAASSSREYLPSPTRGAIESMPNKLDTLSRDIKSSLKILDEQMRKFQQLEAALVTLTTATQNREKERSIEPSRVSAEQQSNQRSAVVQAPIVKERESVARPPESPVTMATSVLPTPAWQMQLPVTYDRLQARMPEASPRLTTVLSDREVLSRVYEIVWEKWSTIEEKVANDDRANLKNLLRRIDYALYTPLDKEIKTSHQKSGEALRIFGSVIQELVDLLTEAQSARREQFEQWGFERIEATPGSQRMRNSEWGEDMEVESPIPPRADLANTFCKIQPGNGGYRYMGKILLPSLAVYYAERTS